MVISTVTIWKGLQDCSGCPTGMFLYVESSGLQGPDFLQSLQHIPCLTGLMRLVPGQTLWIFLSGMCPFWRVFVKFRWHRACKSKIQMNAPTPAFNELAMTNNQHITMLTNCDGIEKSADRSHRLYKPSEYTKDRIELREREKQSIRERAALMSPVHTM